MNLDLIIGFTVVYAIAFAPYIVGAAVLLVLGAVAGTAWDRRRRGGLRDQHRAVAALAVKLAAAEGAPARLRDQLFDAQRDRIMAEERALAYQHRAERERARADARTVEVRDLRETLGRVSEMLRQPEDADTAYLCELCGTSRPFPEQRDHLIELHGIDPAELVSLVPVPDSDRPS